MATPFVVIFCIALYSFLLKIRLSERIMHKMNCSKSEIYFADKVLGGIVFGLIPLIFVVLVPGKDPDGFGITTGRLGDLRVTVILASVLVLIISYRLTANKKFRDNILKANAENLTLKSGFLLASGWIIYIFGYELLFRGILWFSSYDAFGFFPALLINLALYALAHYNMSRTAIIGSIPVGIAFCALSYFTGTFLFAFILHSIMSSAFEIFSLHRLAAGKLSTER